MGSNLKIGVRGQAPIFKLANPENLSSPLPIPHKLDNPKSSILFIFSISLKLLCASLKTVHFSSLISNLSDK
jgi:hypothetical protein